MDSTLELFRHVTAEKAVMYRCIMDEDKIRDIYAKEDGGAQA